MADKTPILKHEHPAYQWIALVVTVALVLALAGWYILTYQTITEDEALSTVQSTESSAVKNATTKNSTEIDSQVQAINTELDSVSSDDFSDTKLDNTSLGL